MLRVGEMEFAREPRQLLDLLQRVPAGMVNRMQRNIMQARPMFLWHTDRARASAADYLIDDICEFGSVHPDALSANATSSAASSPSSRQKLQRREGQPSHEVQKQKDRQQKQRAQKQHAEERDAGAQEQEVLRRHENVTATSLHFHPQELLSADTYDELSEPYQAFVERPAQPQRKDVEESQSNLAGWPQLLERLSALVALVVMACWSGTCSRLVRCLRCEKELAPL